MSQQESIVISSSLAPPSQALSVLGGQSNLAESFLSLGPSIGVCPHCGTSTLLSENDHCFRCTEED